MTKKIYMGGWLRRELADLAAEELRLEDSPNITKAPTTLSTKGYSGSFEVEISPDSKKTMAEWVRSKEADIAANELRNEDVEEDLDAAEHMRKIKL